MLQNNMYVCMHVCIYVMISQRMVNILLQTLFDGVALCLMPNCNLPAVNCVLLRDSLAVCSRWWCCVGLLSEILHVRLRVGLLFISVLLRNSIHSRLEPCFAVLNLSYKGVVCKWCVQSGWSEFFQSGVMIPLCHCWSRACEKSRDEIEQWPQKRWVTMWTWPMHEARENSFGKFEAMLWEGLLDPIMNIDSKCLEAKTRQREKLMRSQPIKMYANLTIVRSFGSWQSSEIELLLAHPYLVSNEKAQWGMQWQLVML